MGCRCCNPPRNPQPHAGSGTRSVAAPEEWDRRGKGGLHGRRGFPGAHPQGVRAGGTGCRWGARAVLEGSRTNSSTAMPQIYIICADVISCLSFYFFSSPHELKNKKNKIKQNCPVPAHAALLTPGKAARFPPLPSRLLPALAGSHPLITPVSPACLPAPRLRGGHSQPPAPAPTPGAAERGLAAPPESLLASDRGARGWGWGFGENPPFPTGARCEFSPAWIWPWEGGDVGTRGGC